MCRRLAAGGRKRCFQIQLRGPGGPPSPRVPVTIEVQGHGGSQNGLWFLELDDAGMVVNAIDRN